MKKFDAAYFTASTDTVETNTKFAKSLDLDYPILSDPDKDAAKAYGVVTAQRSVPFRWTFYIGPDGKISHIEKSVNARDHGSQVAQTLKKLEVKEKE